MKRNLFSIIALLATLISGCKESPEESLKFPTPVKASYGAGLPMPDSAVYYDRVLGALVGSAIGDAMGASTEMWDRTAIRRTYGYINGLTPAVRYKSPEGTWEHNLGAGATTDDTRWKAFMALYIQQNRQRMGPSAFAAQISEYYRSTATELGDRSIPESPEALDSALDRVQWIGEWARVAMAYEEGPEAYQRAKDRFYGGEMSCAGMLYTPVFGLVASDPEAAYELAYAHTIFDLGYARDIAALVAATTRMALQTENMDSLLNTAIFTDPLEFQDSRLVGRLSLSIALEARDYVRRARLMPDPLREMDMDSLQREIPSAYPADAEEWLRQQYVYELLVEDQKATPFHAGEIWQILIAALEWGQGDFAQTMAFIVNYGRDNDTVAAVAGMILGAQMGFEGLPEAEREQVLRINREQLGIDLEKIAHRICGYSN
jgi:ADP-ribosylglycohydrolase